MADSKRNWNPHQMYDASPQEVAAVKERVAMRAELRKEWQMKMTSPYRGVGGYVFDPAIQRFISLRANHWETFKATPKTAALGLMIAIVPIGLLWWKLETDHTKREKKFRTGVVSYRDRDWKFI